MPRTPNPDLAARRKQQIVQAALACFRRRGFHQASMQEICAEAQISAGALYRYFPSKAHLIGAIAEDVQSGVEAILTQAHAGGDPVGALRAVALVMFEEIFVPGEGALVADVMAEAARDPALAQRLRDVEVQTRQRLAEVIVLAQRDGRAAAHIDAETCANLIFATIDGLGIRQSIGETKDPAKSMAAFDLLLGQLFAPLQPAAAPPVSSASGKKRTRAVVEDVVT
jgi:TetR/AcrR family transcriptional regulator, repressor for uid operon